MAKRRPKRATAAHPGAVLFQMMIGKWVSQAISTVVELGIPDHLAKGARPVAEIARQSGASEDGVYRLLRALASVGVFVEASGRRFKLAPIGQLLRTDARPGHAGYARFTGHDSTWRPWGELAYSVKTGQPAFDKVFGMPIFEYFSRNAEASAVFDAAMTSLSTMDAEAIAGAYDFKGVGTLMDVAGGQGLLLATLMRRFKTMRGILFDLPHVTAAAAATFARAGVADRARVESGDFFKALPAGADVIGHETHPPRLGR